jgi:hypothetical protein
MSNEFDRIEPTFGSGPLLPPPAHNTPASEASHKQLSDPGALGTPESRMARSPLVTTQKRKALAPYQKAGRAIRLLGYFTVLIWVAMLAAVLMPALERGNDAVPFVAGLAVAGVVFCSLVFLIAGAVLRRKTWGRAAGILYALLILPAVPVGTVAGLYLLWVLPFRWNSEV